MVLTGKEKQNPERRVKRYTPVVLFIGIIFLVLLIPGKQQRPLSRDTRLPIPPEESFERDVKQFSEPDSGREKSAIGASAVMIGLPFKN
ncbi:hypothetical protein [Marinilabilia rubra]|uniref:Uncharacterized protein n=1 Tax=Marinilabilia rubra TaxID=2162893 RepID=A0A2U2BBP7_9BACT|nr:hypothetical protein [Marinilabilia rubra]PWE00453.1 hypothetical protein DDZ16_05860 [Marinilabilia rubra]